MEETEVILLLSGGIDSATLLAELRSRDFKVHALSFDYGQRHLVELDFAQQNAAHYGVQAHTVIKLDLEAMSSQSMLTNSYLPKVNYEENSLPQSPNETYVPGRNLLMLSHAAAYAETHGLTDIYFAVNADDGNLFPDCQPKFVSALNQVWQCCPNTASLKAHVPYIELSKLQVIQKSVMLGVDLKQTLSCYAPIGNNECGTCLSCVLKKEALDQIISR
jgi:7-cyano-7-deazaguanine synthase